ncbi:hypothetical protein HBI23_253450 [Parastagonospora nodorum]|nr:hypothetical protein HBI23_253450 [Parastagonospora nodorum]KAH5622311.1 hypothetical protein HBI51_247400 [Parastagonospora nodorum]KAH5983406.1 hypothetical protein HBI84_247370 [Parastagonospora nodorum]KAH6133525.1 hypothetical protein HBI68_252710 [Parastagonospora nodorum]KAH6383665.1 hypothetical protein HBI60_254900 [Parastagonospora nodorum]
MSESQERLLSSHAPAVQQVYPFVFMKAYIEEGGIETGKGDFGIHKTANEALGERSLMLEPTVSDRIKAFDIHKQIEIQLSRTCPGEHGKAINIDGKEHRLEYTDHHSRYFVCPDVQGFTTTQILELIDKLKVAETVPIGLHRQRNIGPVVAIHFSEPLKDAFEIKLEYSEGRFLRFRRASSECLLCNEAHDVTTCMDMVEERPMKSPGI